MWCQYEPGKAKIGVFPSGKARRGTWAEKQWVAIFFTQTLKVGTVSRPECKIIKANVPILAFSNTMLLIGSLIWTTNHWISGGDLAGAWCGLGTEFLGKIGWQESFNCAGKRVPSFGHHKRANLTPNAVHRWPNFSRWSKAAGSLLGPSLTKQRGSVLEQLKGTVFGYNVTDILPWSQSSSRFLSFGSSNHTCHWCEGWVRFWGFFWWVSGTSSSRQQRF